MDELTLLSREQIFENNKLNIFKKVGCIASITDFALLLGGEYGQSETGCYWIKPNEKGNIVDFFGHTLNFFNIKDCSVGIRPVLSYSKIKDDISNEIINEDGITEREYGEYPQYAASKELQEKLEELYQNDELIKTYKTYMTDSRKWNESDKDFLPQEHIEYYYDDKKYVRVKANSYYVVFILSNDGIYNNDDYVWVEVLKIKWLVDEENDIALTKYILAAGIQFDNEKEYTGDFKNSNMYKFLNTYFINDIQIQEKNIDISKISGKYEEAMALIEEAKRRHNEILDKSIIGKTLIKHL